MKYQICPVCQTKIAIKNEKKINICPSSLCPNPYMFSYGQVVEEDDETSSSSSKKSFHDSYSTEKTIEDNIYFHHLFLRNEETGKIHIFDCPTILNRSSFSPTDFAISENTHAIIDSMDEKYLVTDASTYQATWINSQRLNTGISGVLSSGDTLRIGNTFLEVLHEQEI